MPDEPALFRALQTCAYRAGRRARSRPAVPAERMEWLRRWERLREYLVERNLGLVYSAIKRFGFMGADRGEQRSVEMLALLRAVDRFDPWRGFRFSTYATHAIRRALIHLARTGSRHRAGFPLEPDAPSDARERVDTWLEWYGDGLRRALEDNQGELSDRESMIIARRFPMDGSAGSTLGQIGGWIGLSKERVRQIQKKALGKLRQVLETDPLLQ